MPVYEYRGLTTAGKATNGLLDADSPRALKDRLRREGVFLSEYVETKQGSTRRGAGGKKAKGSREVSFGKLFEKVKILEVSEVTRQLATLVRAGIPVVDSIGAISEQLENPLFKRVLSEVRRAVNEGSSLANAMKKHPKVFSTLYVNMVAAGEQSGTLDIVFERLADFTEGQVRLRSKLMGAMMYPCIMIGLGFVIVAMMMLFVVPQIQELFDQMGGELPLITRILIGASEFFQSYWWLMGIGMAVFIWWFNKWRVSEKGKPKFDAWLLRVPIFGPLIRMVNVTRFARTLSTLLESGVPILNALSIVRSIMGNQVIADVIEEAREAVKEGHSIAEPLKRSGQFPPMVVHMIAVGEKSGELETMLTNVAESYEMQVESKVTQLTSILEPLMIVVMGVGVAFMVFAIIMPMLEMNKLAAGGG